MSRSGRVRRGREAGHILMISLWILVLLMMAGALIASALHQRMALYQTEQRNVHLTAILDAALAHTMANLASDRDYPGTSETPFDHGTFESAVQRVGYNDRIVIVRATYWAGRRAARALVHFDERSRPSIESWEPVPY